MARRSFAREALLRGRRWSPMLTAAMLTSAIPSAWSASVTWVGGSAVLPEWNQSTNWTSNPALPTAADDVIFATVIPPVPGPVITLGTGEQAKSLTFRNSYTLTGGDLTVATGVITVADTFTATINSSLVGSAALSLAATNGLVDPDAQAGGGTLVLGGANSAFTGAITVGAGTLRIASGTALGSTSAGTSVTSGATLDLNGQTTGEALTLAGAGVGGNGALVNSSGTAAVVNGVIAPGTYTVGGTGNITFNGQVGNAVSTLTKVGANTVTLAGTADNISLSAIVNSGTLILAKASTASAHAIGGGLTVNGATAQLDGTGGDQIYLGGTVTLNNGVLDLNGRDEGFNLLAGTGGTVTNDGTTMNTLTLGQSNGSGAYTGLIVSNRNAGTGDIALTKAGTGTVTLSGANTFGGPVKIQNGTVSVNSIGNVGAASSALGAPQTVAAGTIDLGSSTTVGALQYTGAGATTNRVFNLAGTTFGGTLDASGTGALIVNSALTGTVAGAKTFTLQGTSAVAIQNAFNGVIADPAAGGILSLNKAGTNTWVLNAANTFTGLTSVSGGSLIIAPGASIGVAGTSAGSINVGAGAVGSLVVQAGGDLRVGSGSASFLDVGVRTNATTLTDGTLDVSALTNFTANVGSVRLGMETGSGNGLNLKGTLLLATNNNITATTQVIIGESANNGNAVTSSIALGAGANNFTTPLVIVGGKKSQGLITIAPGGTWTLNNGAGTTNLYVARNNAGTGTIGTGLVDLTGGTFIARLGTFNIGDKGDGLGTNGGATGTFTSGTSAANAVTATSITIGALAGGSDAAANATGTLNWNGGTLSAGTIAIAVKGAGLGTPAGALNLNAGTVSASGGISDGGGTSTVQLTGGTLDLLGSGIGSAANPIDNLRLNTGTLANVGSINGSGGLLKNTPGTLTLAGTNSYTGGTTVSDGTLRLANGVVLPASGSVTVNGGSLDTGASSTNFGTLIANGGTIVGTGTLSATTFDVRSGTISANLGGSGSLTKSTPATATLLGTNTYTGGTSLNDGRLLISRDANLGDPSSAVSFNGGTLGWVAGSNADITANGRSFILNTDARLDTNGNDIVFNRPLSSGADFGGLIKLGAGSLTFAGGNNYLGDTTVQQGTLTFTGTYGLSDVAQVTIAQGARLELLGTGGEAIGSLAGAGSLALGGGVLTVGDGNINTTFSGPISGPVGLSKVGIGVQTLTGNSTFTGPVTITRGVLEAGLIDRGGVASSIGASSNAATNLVLDGGTLRFTGAGGNADRLFTLTERGGTIDASGRGTLYFANAGAIAMSGSGDHSLTLTGSSGGNVALSNTGSSTVASIIGNGASGLTSVTKDGSGVWQLSGTNTYTGVTTIKGGTLVVNNLKNGGTASNLGQSSNLASNLVLDGGTLRYVGAAQTTDRVFTIGTNGGTLDASGSGLLNFNNSSAAFSVTVPGFDDRTLTLTGTGAGALNLLLSNPQVGQLGLTKNGAGTWTITRAGAGLGANTYTGATTVNQGTLAVNFGATGTVATSNLIAPTSALALNGGVLSVNGAGAAVVNAQTFSGTTLARGDSSIAASFAAAVSTGSLTINLGPIAATSGATVDFTLGTNASAANTTFATASGAANTLLTTANGATFATYNNVDWAAKNAGNTAVVGGSTLAGFYTPSTTNSLSGNADVSAGIDTTLAASASLGSLRINRAEARTITLNSGATLTVPGILATATIGNNLTRIIGAGTLQGVAGGGLTIFQNNAANVLQIDSTIADNGGATPLTKSGAGVLLLRGANTYSGGTIFNEGTIRVATDTALGSGTLRVENGGTASVLASDSATAHTLANSLVLNSDLQLGDATGTGTLLLTGAVDLGGGLRTVTSNNAQVTLSGAISNGALIKAGATTLALSNPANTYAGGTYLTAGNLDINGAGSLGTGILFVTGGTLASLGYDTAPVNTAISLAGNFTIGRGGFSAGLDLSGSIDLNNAVRTIGVAGAPERISGVISNGGLTKNNTSDLILSGANTYSGGTTIQNGSVFASSVGALGANAIGNNVSVNPAGANQNPVLRLSTPDYFGSNQQLILNNSRTDAPAAIGLGAAFADGAGSSINFGTTGTGLQNIRVQNNNANYLAVYLDGIQSSVDYVAKIAAVAPLAPVWIGATGATGTYTGATLTPGVGSTYRLGGGGGVLTLAGTNVLTGNNALIVGSPDTTARGLSGTVFIPNAQNFTGAITVGSGGNLTVGSDASLGAASNSITLGGSTLELRSSGVNGSVDTQYAGRSITVTNSSTLAISPLGGLQVATVQIGSLNITGGARTITYTSASGSNLAVTGASTFTGTNAPFAITFNPSLNQTAFLSFNASITEAAGALTLRMNANGTNSPVLVLGADNNYTGITQITRGTVVLANTGAAGAPNSGVTLDPAASTTATLDLRSDATGSSSASPVLFDFGTLTLGGAATTASRFVNVDRVSGLGSAGVLAFGALNTGTSPDLTVTGERGYQLQVSGLTTLGGNFTLNVRGTRVDLAGGITDGASTFGLTKADNGTLLLSGTGTFKGGTVINTGTIVANHDNGSGTVDVFGSGAVSFGSTGSSALLVSGTRTFDKTITNSATGGNQVIGGLDLGTKTFTGGIVATRSVYLNAQQGSIVNFNGTISGAGAVTVGGASGVLPGIAGTPPFGRGTVVLNPGAGTGNSFTGGLVINSGRVTGQAQTTSGSPFGTSTIAMNDGTLEVRGIAGVSTNTVNTALTVGGGANVVLNDLAADSATTRFTISTLARSGIGTLTIVPSLGTGEEQMTISTSPGLTNGILAPWIVKAASDANRAGDFATLDGTNNLITAAYGSSDVNASANNNTSIVAQTTSTALTDNRSAYALKLGGVAPVNLDLNGQNLNVGTLNAAGTFGGLILNNGASITNGRLNFGAGEGLVYVDDAATSTISAGITGTGVNSLTKFGAGTLVLSGNNTYRGATVINRGTLQLGAVNALGSFTNPVGYSAVTLGSGGTLDLQQFATEAGSLAGDFGSRVLIGDGTMFTVGRNNAATTFSGTLVGGVGSILRKNGTGRLTLDNTRAGDAASTLGELRINQGQVQVIVTGQSNGSPFPVSSSLPGSTLVTLRGGTFEVRVSADNSSSLQTLVAGNDLVVSQGVGTLDLNRISASDSNKLVLFGGLTLDRSEFALTGGNTIIPRFTGPVTLTDNARINTNSSELTLDGVISDGGHGFTLNKVGGSTLILGGTSTYSGGTVLTGGSLLFGTRGADPLYSPATTFVPSTTALAGTGDIILNNGSLIRINAPSNLAAGQVVRVFGSPIGSQSQVDLRTDNTLADYHLRTLGTGSIALGSGSTGGPLGVFSQALNLAQIGDGTWGISGSQDTIYTAATLGVGAGNTYRFSGSSSALLILEQSNVLTGSASVEVGRSLTDLGVSLVNYNSLVRLVGSQDYTGNTTLYRTSGRGSQGARIDVRETLATPQIENYGRVEFNGDGRLTNAAGQQVNNYIARPGSSLRLDYDNTGNSFLYPNGLGDGGANAGGLLNKWQDDLAMTLDGSQLDVVNANSAQSVERIGALNYKGGAEIFLERRGTNGQPIVVIGGPLTRTDLGTLAIRQNNPNELGALVIAPGNGNTQRIIFANAADAPQRGIVLGGAAAGTSVSMVAPQFFELLQNQFVDYDPNGTTGFTLVPFTSRNSATFNSGGLNNGTEIIDVNTTAVTAVNAGADVWAMRTSQNIGGSNAITIRSGGLAAATSSNASVTISTPLNFVNNSLPVEADIWTSTGTGSLTLSGAVTANNLTKNGSGILVLANANPGLTGNVQMNGGTMQIRNATSVSGVGAIRLHGAYLNNDTAYEMPRLEIRTDTTVANSAVFAPGIVLSQNLPYAEISVDRFAGSATNVAVTIPTLTFEGGGAEGTTLSVQNGNDFDLTVTGATTLGLAGSTSRIGFNVQNTNGTNRVTLNGVVSGGGSLVKSGNGVLLLQEITNSYSGGTTLNDGTLELANNTATTTATLLGTGAIDVNRGTLRMISDTNNTIFASVNDLNIRGQSVLQFDRATSSGGITAILGGNSSTLRTFGSPNIQVSSASNQVTGRWRGSTVINDNPVFFINGNTLQLGDSSGGDTISGSGHLSKTGSGSLNLSSNAANLFTGGTDVYFGRLNLLTAADTLGSGAVNLYPSSALHLTSPANLTNPISHFYVNATAQTALGLRSNSGATGFTSVAQVNALLGTDAFSALPGQGGLLVGDQTGGNFNWLNDLSALGNGYWYVGSVVQSSNFTLGTIAAGAENVYRFGGGGSNVYFNSSVLNTFLADAGATPNRLVVGKAHAVNASGTVYMNVNANNTFSGGTTVSRVRDSGGGITVAQLISQGGYTTAPLGTGTVEVYGNLQFENVAGSAVSDAGGNRNAYSFHPGARLIFENNTGYTTTANTQGRWADATPIALNSSSVEMVGNAAVSVANSETVGAVSFAGGSELRSARRTTAGSELIINGALTRVGRGTLTLNHDAGLLGVNGTAASSATANVNRIIVNNATGLTAANGMVLPYISDRADNQFLKYDATNGFQLVTQGTALPDYVPTSGLTLNGAVSSKLLDGTAILSQDSTTAVTLGANLDVYALRLQGDINSSADLLSSKITIRSGGLMLYGGTQRTINADLAFGVNGAGEALIQASSQALQINGQISASSVTKFGTNFLNLLQDQNTFSGTWDLNQGAIQVVTPGGLGTGEVVLHGWTGGTAQTQTELRFAYNPLSPDEQVFTSGKITSIDQNLIRVASSNDRISRISAIDLKTTTPSATNLGIPGYLRVQVDGARSVLRSGEVRLFDNYVLNVDAGSFGPGSTVSYAPDALNNQGAWDLTKIGDGVLVLGDNSVSFTGTGRTLLVTEGAVRATSNGAFGGAGVNAVIDNGGALEVAVAGFNPAATLKMQPGAIERWAVDGARTGNYTLQPGVHLQISADQTGTRTIGLNGGSIAGYLAQDLDEVATINTLGAGVSVNLLADSFLGQPFPVAVNNVSGSSQSLFYDTGKGNLMNNPLDPRLQGSYLRVLGNISGAHNLTKLGQDWILISGVNSYDDTTIREGALLLGSSGALPAGKRLTLQADGILDVNGFNAAPGSIAGDSTTSLIANSATEINTLTVGSDNTSTTYAGALNGALALTKVGSGTLELTGTGSRFVGATTISSGVISVSNLGDGGVAGALGSASSAASNLVLDGGTLRYTGAAASSNRAFTLGSGGGTLDASGSGAFTLTSTAAVPLVGNGSRTLTLTGTSTAQNVLAATVGDSVGATTVTKTGPGSWALSASNPFTGPTHVQGGTLAITGALSGTTSVDIQGGAKVTLGGNAIDRINDSAALTLAGGTLAFADPVTNASETLATLTLTANSTLDFGAGVGAGNAFQFTNVSLGNFTLDVYNWTGTTLADTGARGDSQDRLLFSSSALTSGSAAQVRFFSGAGTGFLGEGTQVPFGSYSEIVPVPETSTAMLLASTALLGLAGYRDRRRARRS